MYLDVPIKHTPRKVSIMSSAMDWYGLKNLPLSVDLVKSTAPQVSEHRAMIQIATARHEATHFAYAIKHGYEVEALAVTPKASGVQYHREQFGWGFTVDSMPQAVRGTVESHVAAALFELCLDPDESNPIAEYEEEAAIKAAKRVWDHIENPDTKLFTSYQGIMHDACETVCSDRPFLAPLVSIVAKAILKFRRGDKGYIHPLWLKDLNDFARAYFAKELPEEFYDHWGSEVYMYTLPPYVQKENKRNKTAAHNWKLKTDLDYLYAHVEKQRQAREAKRSRKSKVEGQT